jgi:hypothetical protein
MDLLPARRSGSNGRRGPIYFCFMMLYLADLLFCKTFLGAFQAYDEGSIPFTRSKTYQDTVTSNTVMGNTWGNTTQSHPEGESPMQRDI